MQPKGPSTLAFIAAMRRHGFLDAVGQLWREYGDIFQVKIGPRRLIFLMHPDMVEHVNLTRRDRYDKVASYDAVRAYLTGEGLVTSTGELWRRQRKLMAPFFTPKGIRVYSELITRDSERCRDRWRDLAREEATVDMAEEMTQVAASIILKAMFSTKTLSTLHELKSAIEVMIDFVTRKTTGFTAPFWMPTPFNRRYRAARALVHDSITELIRVRRAGSEKDYPDDLLSRLMLTVDPETGERMSESLLRDEILTAFFAGHETTARTMTFAWHALATHPEVAARLRDELDEVLGGRTPTMDDLRRLPFTLQVVKEVLRLHPPGPFYARDAVAPDQLAGYDIPAGAAIMLSPFYTHRHPEFWDQPETFNPSRWASSPGKGHGHAFHPFATGPRICIGNNFALLESQILLAVLAQRFEPRLIGDYEAKWEMRGVLNLAGGLPMKLVERRRPPQLSTIGVTTAAQA